jgi:single-strand DNA-binding protein
MANLIGVFRLGRDAEVRSTSAGETVTTLGLAYNFGKKGQDGKKPTQWVDCALWGDRGPKLQEWLVQGTQIYAVLEDVRIEEFKKRDGSSGSKLAARVASLEFVSAPRDSGGEGRQQEHRPQQYAAPAQAPRAAPRPPSAAAGSGFDDMDDDIPFITASASYDMTTSKARKLARYHY